MEPIDVYLMYCAMKAHFGKSDYDFVTYKGKTRIKRDSFYKRKDRNFFVRISRKYKTEQEIKNYFIANFIKNTGRDVRSSPVFRPASLLVPSLDVRVSEPSILNQTKIK